jgi:hypothetical protein
MNGYRNVLPLVFLLVAFADTSRAQVVEWTRHHYPENNFEVEFSGPVQITQHIIPAQAKIIRSTSYLQGASTHAYAVWAQLNKEGAGVNLEAAAHGAFDTFGCKKIDERLFGVAGWRTEELTGDQCLDGTYRVHGRYLAKGDWFYGITYMIKMEGGDIQAAQRFLESFKIIGN